MEKPAEQVERIATLNRIRKWMFMWTEVFIHAVIIPAVTLYLLYLLDMGLKNNLIFICVLIVVTSCSLFIQKYQFNRATRPFMDPLLRWAEGVAISDEEYRASRKKLFTFHYGYTVNMILRWILVMSAAIIFVNLLVNVAALQQFNMWAVLLFNVILSVILFFRVFEMGIEKIAATGALNREVTGEEVALKHMSVPLTFIVMLYFSLTLIILGIVIFNVNYGKMKEMVADQMRSVSLLVDKNISDLAGDRAAEISRLAAAEGVARGGAPGRHNALMKRLIAGRGHEEYAFLATAARNPVAVSSSVPGQAGKRIAGREITDCVGRAAAGAVSLSGAHRSPVTGNPAMVLCVPVRAGKDVAGVIGLSIDLNAASKRLIGRTRIGTTGYVYLLDRDMRGMAHPDSRFLLADMKKFDWGGALGELPDDSTLQYEWRGTHRFLYKKENKDLGFYTVSSISISEIAGNMLTVSVAVGVISVVCLTILSFIMYTLINRKLMPLQSSSQVIEAIAGGDLRQRVTVYSDDEVGAMSLRLISFMRRLRDSIRNIKNISEELATSSSEMSSTVLTFADNAQSQAASAEQVSATVEEMAAGMEGVVNGATVQYESMEAFREQLADLSGKINEMSTKIQSAFAIADGISGKARDGEQMMKEMSASMGRIIESSKEMSSILGMITGISEQINLLSLNASIEAARAGDAGRGFAVVADEVSKLADQTASSIKDIDRHIKNNAQETEHGIANSQKTVETISLIIEGVTTMRAMMSSLTEFMTAQSEINKSVNSKAEQVGNLSHNIRTSAEEQKNAVNEIVRSVTSINEVTQANATGTEELSGTSENLSAMAETLKQAVDFFKM